MCGPGGIRGLRGRSRSRRSGPDGHGRTDRKAEKRADGKNLAAITPSSGVYEEVSYNAGITWSPGGDRFIYMSNGGEGNYDLYLQELARRMGFSAERKNSLKNRIGPKTMLLHFPQPML